MVWGVGDGEMRGLLKGAEGWSSLFLANEEVGEYV